MLATALISRQLKKEKKQIYSCFASNSTLTDIGSLKIDSTGQFASVLLQAASKSSFLVFDETLTFMLTPVMIGESGDFSASAKCFYLYASKMLALNVAPILNARQSMTSRLSVQFSLASLRNSSLFSFALELNLHRSWVIKDYLHRTVCFSASPCSFYELFSGFRNSVNSHGYT